MVNSPRGRRAFSGRAGGHEWRLAPRQAHGEHRSLARLARHGHVAATRQEGRRCRLRRRAIDSALFRRWRDRRQAAPATSPATRAAKQLVSCSKCGADRNNCVLSRRSWTRAKKRSVKGARSIWAMIRRLNPMRDKNRNAAAKQVNDSRVRHFSRATYLSNTFQNGRWFRRRELRKYSLGGDGIFVPIFAD